MYYILFSTTLAFLVTYFSIPVIIRVAKVKHLFDEPDARKVHKEVIPTLGGLGIFAGFVIAVLMGVPPDVSPEMQYIVAASLILFFLGINDDIMNMSASKKFIFQLAAAAVVVRFADINLKNLYGLFGINDIPYMASFVISIFTIIVITNALNLIDGVDGLAGSIGFLASVIFGTYFLIENHLAYAVMAYSLAGGIFAFLIYNFSPAKIFMGDTGSLLLGLCASIFVIKFINLAGTPNAIVHLVSAPAFGFAVLMVPLFDTLRVFTLRILDRRSPFSPDRLHIHHYLLDIGFNHRQIALTLSFATVVFTAIAFFLQGLNVHIIFIILFAVALSAQGLLYYKRKKVKELRAKQKLEREQSDFITSKVITMPIDQANVK